VADLAGGVFGPSFSSELVTVSNDVNNRLVRNSGVSHRTLVCGSKYKISYATLYRWKGTLVRETGRLEQMPFKFKRRTGRR
jgi:hypothetical protein